MRYSCYKFFTIGQHEKEEHWLNAMAAKGMMLAQVGGIKYWFEEDTPGKYIYRLEMLNHPPDHPESVAYIKFLEETGIEVIGSYIRWVYYRRPAEDGAFEIYSDVDSKIRHFKRITAFANVLTIILGIVAIIIVSAGYQVTGSNGGGRQGTGLADSTLTILLVEGGLCTLFALIIQSFVLPVRKSLRRLKKEQTYRE
ncbi:DUF2812 domain-containing protein [Paenibacillus tepidiphilus]|uniref:DUF2812 domain-containing protein n=1 Tax=Paenibacillus tepidiphilus TaxID=2608683 RepID=UPI00123AD16C|nr:DUF2812 domain-containing protein [Paenibacillus tepidiphilus]